ncbi:unnamed protein product, partial [Prorocentrum cordatum]
NEEEIAKAHMCIPDCRTDHYQLRPLETGFGPWHRQAAAQDEKALLENGPSEARACRAFGGLGVRRSPGTHTHTHRREEAEEKERWPLEKRP